MRAFLFTVGVLLLTGCGKKPAEPAALPEPVTPEPAVSAAHILGRYLTNPAAAAAGYGKHELRVSLRADRVSQISGSLIVTQIEEAGQIAASLPVQDAARVQSGHTIVVRGKVASAVGNRIVLGECRLDE